MANAYYLASKLTRRQQRNRKLDSFQLALLRDMLARINPHVHVFSRAADRLATDANGQLNIVLTAARNRGDKRDPQGYNLPMADEVAMMIPGVCGIS